MGSGDSKLLSGPPTSNKGEGRCEDESGSGGEPDQAKLNQTCRNFLLNPGAQPNHVDLHDSCSQQINLKHKNFLMSCTALTCRGDTHFIH